MPVTQGVPALSVRRCQQKEREGGDAEHVDQASKEMTREHAHTHIQTQGEQVLFSFCPVLVKLPLLQSTHLAPESRDSRTSLGDSLNRLTITNCSCATLMLER